MSDKNIYQRINAVMADCEYLQKIQAQQGKGIKYDEVNAMLRPRLVNHGIVMVINQEEFGFIQDVEGTKQKVYQGKYIMELINMDKPDEKVTHSVFAQGMDGGDKAPGKAHTYATKIMLVKAFGIETGEDDESRAEKAEKLEKSKVINEQQYSDLALYCITEDGKNWTQTGHALMKAYNIPDISQLPESKFKEALEKAQKHASNK